MNSILDKYIEEGEHQQQDFKHSISSSKKIAITLSAFANTDGGRLLIGVKDSGRISGVNPEEEYHMIEAAAAVYCRPEVMFTHKVHRDLDKYVLEVRIPASDHKPHYAKNEEGKWLAYLRVNDENFLSDPILLEFWKEKKNLSKVVHYEDTDKYLLVFLEENPGSQYKHLAKETRISRHDIIRSMAKLIRWNVVEYEVDSEGIYYYLTEEVD